jgi:YggT family protein
MLADTLDFLIRNLCSFFLLNLLLRFYLQMARAPFGHPLAQFVVKLTNFLVLPTRRWVPSVGHYDSATLFLSWLGAMLMHLLLLLVSPWPVNVLTPVFAVGLTLLGVVEVVKLSFYLLFGATLVQAILSWVNPYNPLAPMLDALTRPLLAPLRRVIPLMGGVDLSPLVLILLLQLALNIVVVHAERALLTYMIIA